MDPFFTTLIAVVIAFPVLAIVSFVMTLGNRERLKRLEFHLARIETNSARLLAGEAPAPAPLPPAPAPSEPLPAAAPEAKAEEGRLPRRNPRRRLLRRSCQNLQGPRQASKSASARNGSSGPAASRSRLAASSPRVRRSSRAGSDPAPASCSAHIVALVLIGAGEWTQAARDQDPDSPAFPRRIFRACSPRRAPAIAYADVDAAYVLYHFIGPGPRFHSAWAGRTRHARRCAPARACARGDGLIGAFVTPLIGSTETPNYLRALSLSRRGDGRRLRACARVAVALARDCRGGCERAVDLAGHRRVLPAATLKHVFHVAIGFVLSSLLIVSGFLFAPPVERGNRSILVSSGALGAYLFAAMLLVLATGHDSLALLLFCVLVVGTLCDCLAHRFELSPRRAHRRNLRRSDLLALGDRLRRRHARTAQRPGARQPVEARALSVRHAAHTRRFLRRPFPCVRQIFLCPGRRVAAHLGAVGWPRAAFAPIASSIPCPIIGSPASTVRFPSPARRFSSPALFALATEILTKRERAKRRDWHASGIFATGAVASLALA